MSVTKIFAYVYATAKEKNSGYKEIDGYKVPKTPPSESFQVLLDTCIAYESKLYFIAMSGLRVYIETFLRERLIDLEVKTQEGAEPSQFLSIFDSIEKEIEQGDYIIIEIENLKEKLKTLDGFQTLNGSEKSLIMQFSNSKRKFQHIIRKLVEHGKVSDTNSKNIIKQYHIIRSAVQHGVYRRLYNEYKSKLEEMHPGLTQTNITQAMSVNESGELIVSTVPIESHQRLFRTRQIQAVAELACNDAIEIVYMLLKDFPEAY